MKKIMVSLWLCVLFTAIVALFWRTDWVYKLPTPIPENYVNVPRGERIDVAATLPTTNGKPVFVHFFNPDCPCSKFNAAHFKSLVKSYQDRVNFVIVPVTKSKFSVAQIQDFYDLKLPVLFNDSIAEKCGVYSTPQAVIIDTDQRLYYRGNYNKSRYCTDKKSEYAWMALDSLLQKRQNPIFSQYALTAYGCKFPGR